MDAVGEPRSFEAGPFAGKTVRAELLEIQHADRGRKFVSTDRRPLDPPPMCELRLFEVFNVGTNQHMETPLSGLGQTAVSGFLCHIDLFLVEGPDIEAASRRPPDGNPGVWERRRPTDDADVLARVANFPITQTSCCTGALVGETFAHVVQISDRLLFTFGDVASTLEGYFVMRYRVFNIFSSTPGMAIPVLAECFGQPFRVYSTKDFPGLEPSTELTKMVQAAGVKVVVRAERAVRQRSPSPG